jgi:hypothetical protein
MVKAKDCGVALVVVGAVLMAWPALGHHAFSAEFDGSKTFVVSGVLEKVDWSNPHTQIYLDAMGKDGKTVHYSFSSGPPSSLRRAGVTRADFKIGEMVTITGAPSKNGDKFHGWMKMIKYADGHVFVYRDGSE